jgi:alkyl hydroperoxide reductase subunit D
MILIPPADMSNPDVKLAATFERLAEMFAPDPVPDVFRVYANVPSFLHDFYMNFKKFVWTDGSLDVRSKSTIALAVALALKSQFWTDFFSKRCLSIGSLEQNLPDVAAIVSSCQMYNVFFKFRDIAGSDLFTGMGVGLRAHTFSNTSIDSKMVEFINIVISDINGCKPCTAGHVDKIRSLGVADEAILEAVQCAATMAAGCSFLNMSYLEKT